MSHEEHKYDSSSDSVPFTFLVSAVRGSMQSKSQHPDQFVKAVCFEPIFNPMSENIARVCFAATDPRPSGLDNTTSVQLAVTENPRNASLSIPIGPGPMPPPSKPLSLAMMTGKFWSPGTILKVRFLSGSDWQKNKVKQMAPFWSTFGNIGVQFVDSGDCHILIDFNPTVGSWSYIGTDSKYFADQGQASMNLGWITDNRSDDDLRQVILHEFGHALGAVHEHESPYANIPWNREQVYKDLGGPPNNWDKAKVDQNMFTLYTLDTVQATQFDPKSIMLYYYPPNWTTDGKGTAYNVSLSDADKAYVKFCYPFGNAVDAGQANTLEIRGWSPPQLNTTVSKAMQVKYASPPRIACGLSYLDFDCKANIRINAVATDITPYSFNAHFDAWADTLLFSAGMSYLELGPAFDYIQTGTLNTQDIRPWNQPQTKNSKRCTFSTPFSEPPQVVCWINFIDVDHTKNCRLAVYPTDIDAQGFTGNIDSWSDTVMFAAGMTWIAYPSKQQRVASGTFSTNNVRQWNQPCPDTSGQVNFGNAFTTTPKLMMALNFIDYDFSHNTRFRCSTSSVTQSNFVWHLTTWADSIMYASGCSWFAWQ